MINCAGRKQSAGKAPVAEQVARTPGSDAVPQRPVEALPRSGPITYHPSPPPPTTLAGQAKHDEHRQPQRLFI